MNEKDKLISALSLLPHPEGGYYRETYRSGDDYSFPQFESERSVCTAIYFLIEKHNFSALHKIKSDEIWHFYAGDPLEVIELDERGVIKKTLIGPNIESGEVFQYVVRANTWFGSRVKKGAEFSLVGCTVAPGFDFRDFDLGLRSTLVDKFPQHKSFIEELTRR